MYKPVKHLKNIIVGAGPAGIQLGYFFQKAGIEYVILERNELAGSFFDNYPLSGQLISINKRFTGVDDDDFNLRHDWNSLLSDDGPKFTEYSKEYYPDRKDLVRYINDFAAKYKLNIKYKTNVEKIIKTKEGKYNLTVTDTTGKWLYSCDKLIVATGIEKPNRGGVKDTTERVKHYADFPKDFFRKEENLATFENKQVLIIGNGNSAFELANLLTPLAASINILGRSFKNWAMSTHYAGDLRSIYLPFHDTFLLKSLNSFNETGQAIVIENGEDGKYITHLDCGKCKIKHPYPSMPEDGYDHIILCTGWEFDTSIFNFELPLTHNKKYPLITDRYESVDNPNLFFIGSLMHSLDFKRCSGGFIHGFRYLIKYFFHLNYDGKLDIQKYTVDNIDDMLLHILYKINNGSAMYQMFGQLVDIFIYNPKRDEITYINDVHFNFLKSHASNEALTYFVLSLEYSDEHVTEIPKIGGKFTSLGKEGHATLIHPVLRVLRDDLERGVNRVLVDVIHFDEDLFAKFTDNARYVDKLTRTLKMFIN
jgi:thioredoxin reductase